MTQVGKPALPHPGLNPCPDRVAMRLRINPLWLLPAAALLVAAGLLLWSLPGRSPSARAIAAVEDLGGTVRVDAERPDQPVVAVNLTCTATTDDRLTLLQDLPDVRTLNLGGTAITDAGLAHLEGLPRLQELYLPDTAITDAGLVHLKRLTSLHELDLSATRVTDEGLKALQGLTQLHDLFLGACRVTDKGVRQLQEALPGLTIHLSPY